MKKLFYEISLLELRQTLREAEKTLRKQSCTDLIKFRKVVSLKKLVQTELIKYRQGNREENKDLLKLIEG